MDSIVPILINAGVPKVQVRIVEVLSDNKPHTSKIIEHTLYLRQPEVSLALRDLREFITITEKKSEEKGRPIKVYVMNPGQYNQYLKSVIDRNKKKAGKFSRDIAKLREICGSAP
jgi:predicted transcriptional regulator